MAGKSRKELYTGRAGHHAVMAEFLIRGYNVAIPEVDVGDDIFVVKDSDGTLNRIQVKTATTQPVKTKPNTFSALWQISYEQLIKPIKPELHYVLVSRAKSVGWENFVVISREKLHQIYLKTNHQGLKTNHQKKIKQWGLKITFSPQDANYKSQSFQEYINHFASWPEIQNP